MVVVEELEHALARGATSMLKSLATAQPLMAQTWLLRLAKGAVRCMKMAMHGVDTPIDYLNSWYFDSGWRRERTGSYP